MPQRLSRTRLEPSGQTPHSRFSLTAARMKLARQMEGDTVGVQIIPSTGGKRTALRVGSHPNPISTLAKQLMGALALLLRGAGGPLGPVTAGKGTATQLTAAAARGHHLAWSPMLDGDCPPPSPLPPEHVGSPGRAIPS